MMINIIMIIHTIITSSLLLSVYLHWGAAPAGTTKVQMDGGRKSTGNWPITSPGTHTSAPRTLESLHL